MASMNFEKETKKRKLFHSIFLRKKDGLKKTYKWKKNAIIINYKKLNDTLTQLENIYPSRIHTDIDLLSANIRDNLFSSLAWDNITISIDDENMSTFISWKEIEWFVYAIYNHRENPTASKKMYKQIRKAEEQARQLWIYEKVFKILNEENKKD